MNTTSIPSLNVFHSPFVDKSMSENDSYSLEQFSKVTSSQSRNSDVTIMTTEGDKVTLSSSLSTSATYLTYDQYGRMSTGTRMQDSEMHLYYFDFEKNQDMTIQVVGDLNEEEMRQIHKALKIINRAMINALSGDMKHSMKHAMKIAKLDTISSVDAVLEIERKVSIEKQVQVSGLLPENSPERIGYITPHTSQTYNEQGTLTKQPDLNNPVEEVIQAVEKSGVAPSKIKKPIQTLFDKITRGLPKETPQADYKHKLIQMMFVDLMERIDHLKDPKTAETNSQENK